jgi:hypothetical protein
MFHRDPKHLPFPSTPAMAARQRGTLSEKQNHEKKYQKVG